MYVMQQTTEGEELLYCNGILSEGFLIVFMIYSRYMQKKKACGYGFSVLLYIYKKIVFNCELISHVVTHLMRTFHQVQAVLS